MGGLLLLIVVVCLPSALFGAVIGAGKLYRRVQNARPALPDSRPIEVVWRDLRRLHSQLEDIENAPADMPAKNARCRATRAAYLDALGSACRQFEIPEPAGRPVPDAEIYRVEVELRRFGVDVRPAV